MLITGQDLILSSYFTIYHKAILSLPLIKNRVLSTFLIYFFLH